MHGVITFDENSSSRLCRLVRLENSVLLLVATTLIFFSVRRSLIRLQIIMPKVTRPSRKSPSSSSIPRDLMSLSCTLKPF